MLIPCQPPIWCLFKGTSPIFHLCFWCSSLAMPGMCSALMCSAWSCPFCFGSHWSLASPLLLQADTLCQLIPEYQCWLVFPYSVSHTQNRFIVNVFKDLCARYSFIIHISKYTCETFDKDSCPVILPKHVLFLPCPPLPVWKHLLSHLCFGRMLKNLF